MATSIRKIKSDVSKETNGVWVTYPGTDIECLIARNGNAKFEERARQIRRARSVSQKIGKDASMRDVKRLVAPAIAEHVLLGWKNLVDEGGAEIEYSVARATDMLLDPALDDFYSWVLATSNDVELFRAEDVAETAKN